MADVLPFAPRHVGVDAGDPDGDQAWLHGRAVCMACRTYWDAAAPLPVVPLECPGCHAMRGVFVQFVQFDAPGLQQWHCVACQFTLFGIYRTGDGRHTVACAGCGSVSDLQDAFT